MSQIEQADRTTADRANADHTDVVIWWWIRPYGWALLALATVCTAVLTGPWENPDWLTDWESHAHTSAGLLASSAAIAVPLLILVTLTGLHYLGCAAAMRAASDHPLPWRATYLSQLSAAAANRICVGGIGGALLNIRFLKRQGVSAARATGAVAALRVSGAIADLVLFGIIGVVSGNHVGGIERSLGGVMSHPWLLAVAAVTAATIGIVAATRNRDRPSSLIRTTRTCLAEFTDLRRRPKHLAMLLALSAGTTVLLGSSLTACLALVTGPAVLTQIGSIVAAYMVGMAVGSAIPVPGGIGTTDAALTAAVIAAHIAPGQALSAVLIFRMVTYWAPAALGVLAARQLRRTGAY